MIMMRCVRWIKTIHVFALTLMTTLGIFYQEIRFTGTKTNVYGDEIELFGRGIYAYESFLKGTIYVGTDSIILILVIPLIVYVNFIVKKKTTVHHLLTIALGVFSTYYVASLAFGAMMNVMFIVYIIGLASSIGVVLLEVQALDIKQLNHHIKDMQISKGFYVFMIVFAASTMIWMFEIIDMMISGRPSDIIGFQATEISFVLDLAIILPLTLYGLYGLKYKKVYGVVIIFSMLVFACLLGFVVLGQTVAQIAFGYELGVFEVIVYILPFMILSGLSVAFILKGYQQYKSREKKVELV